MTAEVIVLPRVYMQTEAPSRWERLQGRLHEVRGWARRSPVVVIRRTELGQRERNAFELGRDCERYLDH